MEKMLAVLAAVFLVVGLSTVGFAGGPNVIGYAYYPDTMLRAVEMNYGTNTIGNACGIGETYSGMIAWVDRDEDTMMVRGEDGSKIFDVSMATMVGQPKPNQFVTVNYTVTNGERIASSVTDVPKKLAWEYVYEH